MGDLSLNHYLTKFIHTHQNSMVHANEVTQVGLALWQEVDLGRLCVCTLLLLVLVSWIQQSAIFVSPNTSSLSDCLGVRPCSDLIDLPTALLASQILLSANTHNNFSDSSRFKLWFQAKFGINKIVAERYQHAMHSYNTTLTLMGTLPHDCLLF